ncbi:MAG TPA: helix-turn-helix domain-containing protein [Acidimicrobiales bacterium]|nr:helix-turn-helix domain-containing protein [Acidimicrobiales bacterium]
MSEQSGEPSRLYAQQVGQRLRAIRRQKGLSLQEVEAISDHEFKASVLGAYERGERVISVPRLQRLAQLYTVPVDQLLPRPAAVRAADGDEGAEPGQGAPTGALPDKVTFDLTRFDSVDDPQLGMVFRYLNSIMVLRQDFNGRVLTVRRDDIRAMAGLFGLDPGDLVRRLDDRRLRVAVGAARP